MKGDTLVEHGWALAAPGDDDIHELMGWFPDARSVDIWGGPRFRYPFTLESFRLDCRLDEMLSYCLRDPGGALAGFGQVYERDDRGHLARLITHPNRRRQGIGRRLIEMLCTAARQSRSYNEYSLFVYRDNEAAYRCYLTTGFVVRDYPDDAPMKERCYFLTRSADLIETGQT
jgi:ribosomal protein S18 acetylase RimI-like enzyme